MLMLGRAEGETVVIVVPPSSEATRIEVVVKENRRKRVRLGFEAPEHAAIVRKEIEAKFPAPLSTQG